MATDIKETRLLLTEARETFDVLSISFDVLWFPMVSYGFHWRCVALANIWCSTLILVDFLWSSLDFLVICFEFCWSASIGFRFPWISNDFLWFCLDVLWLPLACLSWGWIFLMSFASRNVLWFTVAFFGCLWICGDFLFMCFGFHRIYVAFLEAP